MPWSVEAAGHCTDVVSPRGSKDSKKGPVSGLSFGDLPARPEVLVVLQDDWLVQCGLVKVPLWTTGVREEPLHARGQKGAPRTPGIERVSVTVT